jgi:hypothetical protein
MDRKRYSRVYKIELAAVGRIRGVGVSVRVKVRVKVRVWVRVWVVVRVS